jgi:hypothetical protein
MILWVTAEPLLADAKNDDVGTEVMAHDGTF